MVREPELQIDFSEKRIIQGNLCAKKSIKINPLTFHLY